ncbi:uncharacterized protein DUF58 [Natranaerovirga pectinivora]|uniref:Uncharacterized protein DUF58 n=1 Tax=Natranaerovirga pectinivora TaxID=682400 RepID=A0A4R3MLI2_9FIRM|nr:DUF58 domain-containing protein [Natranaerovirga pectinivora]TCT15556.1 uncharacterized protein DUF58 [Natranaerovirga pectinivora]
MNENIFDEPFFKKLNRLNFLIKMSLSQGANGGRKSLAKGTSVEFSDYREYIQGDDFRRIDWNAYGRFEKLFIKLFMEEREAVFNIFLDCSRSMDFGEAKKSKVALQLTAAISYIVLNNMDRLQIHALKDNDIKTIKTGSGKGSFQNLLKDLNHIQFENKTEISTAVRKKDIRNRGVSIIISDFFCKESIEDAIKYLAFKKQEVIVIHLLAREEMAPSFDKMVNLIDSETEQSIKISMTPNVLKLYEKTFNNFCKDIELKTKKYNGNYVQIISDEPLEKIVLQSFSSKGLINKV